MAEGSSAAAGEPSAPSPSLTAGKPRRERRPLDHVQLVPGDVVGTQREHLGDVGGEQLRGLAGDAVDQVEAGAGDAGAAQAAEGRGRVRLRGPAEHRAQLRREALRAERDADAGPDPAAPGSGAEPRGRRPRGVLVVDVLRVGLDRDLRVRREVRPEELEHPLEPLRPQQARRAAAEVERVEAAHVVRRPLPLPLGGERVHVPVEPAGGLRPGPPVAGRDRHRREVAVVALRAAEGDVHVDVPHGALERGAGLRLARARARGGAHDVGTQK